jgi:hypothetical protein
VRRCVVAPLLVRTLQAIAFTAVDVVVMVTHDPALILYWIVKLILETAFASFWYPNRSRNGVSRPMWEPGPQ